MIGFSTFVGARSDRVSTNLSISTWFVLLRTKTARCGHIVGIVASAIHDSLSLFFRHVVLLSKFLKNFVHVNLLSKVFEMDRNDSKWDNPIYSIYSSSPFLSSTLCPGSISSIYGNWETPMSFRCGGSSLVVIYVK